LLLRLSGSFLLRFAERRFLGLLFQEPPRLTRLREGTGQAPAWGTGTIAEERITGGIERPAAKHGVAQAPGMCVLSMRDPRAHAQHRLAL
jgi:hypothetical protein